MTRKQKLTDLLEKIHQAKLGSDRVARAELNILEKKVKEAIKIESQHDAMNGNISVTHQIQ